MWFKYKRFFFSQILNNVCEIPLSQLFSPLSKRDLIFVQIDEDVANCKKHPHARIILSKGNKPLTLYVCKKLDLVWKSMGS